MTPDSNHAFRKYRINPDELLRRSHSLLQITHDSCKLVRQHRETSAPHGSILADYSLETARQCVESLRKFAAEVQEEPSVPPELKQTVKDALKDACSALEALDDEHS